jgi:serine/threonine-protein kinase HipA
MVVSISAAGTCLPDASALQPLSSAEIAQAVGTLRQHPLGVDQDVRVSLGGLQSKLLLVQVDGGWARPVGGAASTHILKPDPPEFPGLVASEAFAQRVAALAGLDAADVRLETFGDRLVLVVTRFDRELREGRMVRRHQEDGCQALGTNASGPAKYQAPDGRISYQRLAAVLAAHASDQTDQFRRLGAMVTFTVAVGNTDAHLRNHSFMHDTGTLSLAPVYDAAPTAQFAGTRDLALWVGGQAMLAVVTRGHIVRELVSWGMETDEAAEVISSALERIADALNKAAQLTPEVPRSVVEATEARVARLLRQH